MQPELTTAQPVKQGAALGGWVCFGLGIITMYLSLFLFFIYGPLFCVALILSVVAMAQRRIVGGLVLLLCCLLVAPALWMGLTTVRGTETLEQVNEVLDANLRAREAAIREQREQEGEQAETTSPSAFR